MNNHDALAFTRAVARVIISMNDAMQNAGGRPLSLKRIEEMTLLEFIALVAPNDILFTYIGSTTPS